VNSSLQAAALRYAANGLPVFLLSRSKRPVRLCRSCANADASHDPQACRCLMCHGFYAATTDPRAIARMFALEPYGLLALRTGSLSRLVVIDVDPDAGGMASLARFVAEGLTPPTRYVRTGSGGLHLYYRYPRDRRVPSSQGRIAPGVDVRGDGGYAVLPPSPHPRTRRPYEWADESAHVLEMPAPLVAVCQPAQATVTTTMVAPPTTRPTTLTSGAGISSPASLLSAHISAVLNSPPGRRRTTLYGSARGVARMVAAGAITSADAIHALTDAGRAVKQPPRDIAKAITGAFADEGVAA
jgi:hypothetical protein